MDKKQLIWPRVSEIEIVFWLKKKLPIKMEQTNGPFQVSQRTDLKGNYLKLGQERASKSASANASESKSE